MISSFQETPVPSRPFDPEIVWQVFSQLVARLMAHLPYLILGVVVFALFLVAARLVKRILITAGRRTRLDLTLADLLGRLASAFTIILGLLVAAVVIFPTFNPGDLIAGLGITSVAIGNPLGIGQTVTLGIISAKGRRTGLSNGSFEDFLQTDAPINRGNSGGALVDSNGDLVGINSQILSPSGGSIGIGFAIPSNMARNVLDQLVKQGKVTRGHLGVVVQPVTEDIAASLKLNDAKGVVVSQVQPGSAAERVGLKRGDVILALNGNVVSDPNSFRNDIAGTPPGRTITLRISRDGSEQELRPTLGEFTPEERPARPTEESSPEPRGSDSGRLGIAVEPLTPALARELGISADTQGLIVVEVDTSGPAADAGIQRGDVIEQVNQQPVRSVADLRSAIERAGKDPLLLLVNHRGATIFVTIRPR